MADSKRSFSDYSPEEKLIFIDAYLDGMTNLDDPVAQKKHVDWLRRHIPSYNKESGDNFVFISYSHKDYQKVYRDLSFFLYNNEKRVRFWYDEGLPAGNDWFESAEKSLNSPNCVGAIFYLSESFLKSGAVGREIELITGSGKPFVTIALDEGKFSAESILGGDTPATQLLNDVFNQDRTVLPYTEEYEDVLYRIDKIEQQFSVTESVFSDFVCEEVEDGLCLVEYNGNRTDVYIPEQIGGKEIVEIRAAFNEASLIRIPHTVKRITPCPFPIDTYEDVQELESSSVQRLLEHMLGGFQQPGSVFGEAPMLETVSVDERSEYFYDKDGVLYSRDNFLIKFPALHRWQDEYLDGVVAIGDGAFYGCTQELELTIPSSIEIIGNCAFAKCFGMLEFEDGVTVIGAAAFYASNFMLVTLPKSLALLGPWAFKDCAIRTIFCDEAEMVIIPLGAFFGARADIITLPRSAMLIEQGAFALCECDYFSLPDTITAIGEHAFASCNNIFHISLPQGLQILAPNAFNSCDKLRQILFEGTRAEMEAITEMMGELEEDVSSFVICSDEKKRLKEAEKIREQRDKALEFLQSL